jgi:hypothetical protein
VHHYRLDSVNASRAVGRRPSYNSDHRVPWSALERVLEHVLAIGGNTTRYVAWRHRWGRHARGGLNPAPRGGRPTVGQLAFEYRRER